jgi:transposase
VDTLNPGRAWRKRDDQVVVRKVYSEEFRRDAVELYRTTEGSTVASIAADLGIVDTTLSGWLKAAGVPIRGRHPRSDGEPPPGGETADQELARLRARVAELEADQRNLGAERDILRAAARYFAGETRW